MIRLLYSFFISQILIVGYTNSYLCPEFPPFYSRLPRRLTLVRDSQRKVLGGYCNRKIGRAELFRGSSIVTTKLHFPGEPYHNRVKVNFFYLDKASGVCLRCYESYTHKILDTGRQFTSDSTHNRPPPPRRRRWR